jgi:ATP-dependent RNA helicase RhlE
LTSIQTDGFGQNSSAFASLGLAAAIVRATADESYTEPTPVQKSVVPHVIAGRDILACAQTGTGKTAAFVLPILHRLATADAPRDGIAALVLTPTRELAAQISERVSAYGRYLGIKHAVVYGGVSQYKQEIALRNRPRLLVATPGRLLDLMNQGFVRLDRVTYFVLDEADRMLDMGFINDVRRVTRELPAQRQTLLFSATVPRPIEALAQSLLKDPVRVDVTPTVSAAETVQQSVVFVPRDQKSALLERVLLSDGVERAIVFTRTKHGANKLSQRLERAGIDAPALHGNKSQAARERALGGFRGGKTRVLVATDIAARGIDVDGISHVINYDLPNVPESYVHRVGRTGRAGARGQAISFVDRDERGLLRDIERLLRQRIDVLDEKTFGDVTPSTQSMSASTQPNGENPQRNGANAQPNGGHEERNRANAPNEGHARRQGDSRWHGADSRRDRGGSQRHGGGARYDHGNGQRHGGNAQWHGGNPQRDGANAPRGRWDRASTQRDGVNTPNASSNGGNAWGGASAPSSASSLNGASAPNGASPPRDGSAPPQRRFQGSRSSRWGKRNSHW